jgi:predicted ribosome quality control (RQC) complex YloA/Tae2 family protein
VHIHYFFLKQLTNELQNILPGMHLAECYSQSKDELILSFCNEIYEFYIRAALSPPIISLSFPDNFQRARKNSVDLFQNAIGKKVISLRQYTYDRSFSLNLEDNLSLLFKLHGNRSNILLFDFEKVSEVFRKKIKHDYDLKLNDLDKNPDLSRNNFLQLEGDMKKILPALGRVADDFLMQNDYMQQKPEDRWTIFQKMIKVLESPDYFYIIEKNRLPVLTLFKEDKYLLKSSKAVETVNFWYSRMMRDFYSEREKQTLLQTLEKRIQQIHKYLAQAYERLEAGDRQTSYRQTADLIMANLHNITDGVDKVMLHDFYHSDKPVEIRLKKDLSPQKNAENYYRKAKNEHIGIQKLEAGIQAKEQQLAEFEKWHEIVLAENDIKNLRNIAKQLLKPVTSDEAESDGPCHVFQYEGYTVLVGKNAKKNDELTLKIATKNDLWLHVKDAGGSHVVIREKPGQNFSKSVIEKAASLAAYYSKKRNETWCPVSYTLKKYVRKPGKAAPGAVRLEREKVLLVKPCIPE